MTLPECRSHSQRIGDFGAALEIGAIPPDVIDKVKLHLLDAVAVTYAFARDPLAQRLVDIATRGQPLGRAAIIGFSERTSAREAAFVNGALGHGMDFDGVHVASITHPTVVVAPAVLALAEAEQLTGRAVLVATIFGVEVCARLGRAGGAAMIKRGIPPMTTCGALAAAAAAAKILGLDAHAIAAAIGLAGSFASGSHEWTVAGTNSKLTTPGWAARSGVISATMAQGGFDGSVSAIEGRKGLLVSMAGPNAFDLAEPSADLGERWETRNLALKRFPSCQGTQPYVAAALKLVREHAVKAADIVRVDVTIGAGVGVSLCEPHDMKRSPPNPYAAKFSIPFCIALALTEGDVRLAHFEEDWPAAQQAGNLAMKVHHIVDRSFDVGAADRAHVRVILVDGRVFEAEQRTSQSSLSIGDVAAKFANCAGWRLNADQRHRIIDAFMDLEHIADVSSVMAMLAPAAPRNLFEAHAPISALFPHSHPTIIEH
jgi:2-methylcitrate dehydratase PrpD